MELAGHEAIVLRTYYDGGNVPTVLIGHTAAAGAPIPVLPGQQWTVHDAISVLQHDLLKYEAGVRAAFTVPISQTEFDAAVSFHFETGAIGYATWVKRMNQGRRADAVAAMLSWSLPKSIIPRRKKEQLLFDKGIYSNGGFATEYQTDGNGHVIWTSGQRVDLRSVLSLPAPAAVAPAGVPANPKAVQPPPSFGSQPIVLKPAPPPVGLWARFLAFFRSHVHLS